MLASTATIYNCTGGGNGDVPSNISLSDISDVSSALITNDAWMILDAVGGEDKFGTSPVRDAFLGLGHTRLSKDLDALNGFNSKWNYSSADRVLRSEWGAVNNVRFMLSSVASVSPFASALGNDVFNIFVQGMESLACIYQDNFSSQFLYRPPIFSDALFQNVTLGYVFAEVPKIINDLWITNMRCTLA